MGAKMDVSHALLHSETGIEKLQVRRDPRKLVQMDKIQTDQCPSTLRELIPETAICMTRTGSPGRGMWTSIRKVYSMCGWIGVPFSHC